MVGDTGDAIQAKQTGRRMNSLWVGGIFLAVVLGYPAYRWHKEWSGTGTARNAGARIYGELQAIEPDVLSGRIKDPNDPRFAVIDHEMSRFDQAHQNQSFDDSMLFAGLSSYKSTLSMMAMANTSPATSVDRGRDLTTIQQNKSDIEKYLK